MNMPPSIQCHEKRGLRGFTLIEVLMAMTIFAVGILALAGLQAGYIGGNAAARVQTEATAVASEYLEWLRSLPYDHFELRPVGTHHDRSGAYRVVWSVHENDVPSGTKTLRVTVTPENIRSAAPVRLTTVIASEHGSKQEP